MRTLHRLATTRLCWTRSSLGAPHSVEEGCRVASQVLRATTRERKHHSSSSL